jgi:tRNA(Ile)-lysidine synthase
MIASRVLDTIRRDALLDRGCRLVVALSGGSDSVALLRLLRELEVSGELGVAAAVHLNHGLRGDAGRDEEFCRALSAELGVAFRSGSADVRGRAAREGLSLEDAGRRSRYELFERVADELGAEAIATGHTRDDQAETFLLRLIRGAGPRGLAGIHPRSGRVVRPLLDIGRDELRAYLASLGQAFCEDATNEDVSIPRNRVRHELLPLLERRFSPGIRNVLAREAAIARHDEDRLHREAIDLADSIVLSSVRSGPDDTVVEVSARALADLPTALALRVARLALDKVSPGRFMGFDHAERLLELARCPVGHGAASLPGQHVVRRDDVLVLSRMPFRPFLNSFCVPLSIPGEVVLESQGWAISATSDGDSGYSQGTAAGVRPGTDRLSAEVQGLSVPLTVRSRRPGDRFKPPGMQGQGKKLQDFLVDRKIARDRRDSLPLVVDRSNRIVWVVGEAVGRDFQVTEPSQGVIFLKARRLGGQG